MYAALWRLLPGPWYARLLILLLLAAAVIAACFLWLFPAIAPLLPINEGTVSSLAPSVLEGPLT